MECYEIGYHRVDLRQMPSQEELNRCALLLYQHLGDNWDNMASHRVLPRLPEACRAIQLPKLSSFIYWPYFNRPEGADPSWCSPSPEFPYLDSFLLERVNRGMKPDCAVKEYLSHDTTSEFDFSQRLADNVEYLREPHNCRDIDLNHLILDRLDKEVLFASPNHPSIEILYEEANLILSLLGYDVIGREEVRNSLEEWDFFLPVHPSIIDYFSLSKPDKDTRYINGDTERNFEEYAFAYAHHYTQRRKVAQTSKSLL